MEKIKMTYIYDYKEEDGNMKIEMQTGSKAGLNSSEVCELFETFMKAIGFDFEEIAKYFNI